MDLTDPIDSTDALGSPDPMDAFGALDEDEPVYTLDEARALVPQIRATLVQVAIERLGADEAHAAVHRRHRLDPDGNDDERRALDAHASALRARVRGLLDHLESLGVVVRDLEQGLVDIPTTRDGRPAWLCWQLADPELAWWHTTTEGFSSRRPV